MFGRRKCKHKYSVLDVDKKTIASEIPVRTVIKATFHCVKCLAITKKSYELTGQR